MKFVGVLYDDVIIAKSINHVDFVASNEIELTEEQYNTIPIPCKLVGGEFVECECPPTDAMIPVEDGWETLGSVAISKTFPSYSTTATHYCEVPCGKSILDKYSHFRLVCKEGSSFKINSTAGYGYNIVKIFVKYGDKEFIQGMGNSTSYPSTQYILNKDVVCEQTVNLAEHVKMEYANCYYTEKNYTLPKQICIECSHSDSNGSGNLECFAVFELQGRR